jgi:transcriptional antiterminator
MKKWVKASFTVEYTLILPFVFMVIFFIIFCGFYLHDEVVLEAMCLECLMTENRESTNWNEFASKYTFCSTQVQFNVSKKLTTIQTSYEANVKIPYRESFKIKGSEDGNKYVATDFIRAYKQSVEN